MSFLQVVCAAQLSEVVLTFCGVSLWMMDDVVLEVVLGNMYLYLTHGSLK